MRTVAFSTGGAYLTAMLGMLDQLSDRLEGVDSFAGISAGAIIAAFCATRPISQAVTQLKSILVEHIRDAIKPHYKYLNMPLSALFQKSILDDSGLIAILKQELDGKPLVASLYVGLTNETKMQYELHEFEPGVDPKGALSISQAVHGSSSVPVVFEGETSTEFHYSDGGVFHQIPVLAIKRMLERASREENRALDLTIISSSAWGYRPPENESKLPYLAQKTIHYLDCTNFNNLGSDREILRECLSLFKPKVRVKFQMYSVPSKILRKLHSKFNIQQLATISMADIDHLLRLGKNIVLADSATYSIDQDEPAPILKY
jgi:predicted acylesterase/phospholipase RssA